MTFEDFFGREARGQLQRAALILGSREDASDVVQEALLRVYQRFETLDDPGSYLNRTVLNLCRDRFRRRATVRRVQSRLHVASASTDIGTEVLGDVLARLPYNHRAAIVLRYWGGLDYREIAHQMGCSPGSVGPWIDRGLASLRRQLSAERDK